MNAYIIGMVCLVLIGCTAILVIVRLHNVAVARQVDRDYYARHAEDDEETVKPASPHVSTCLVCGEEHEDRGFHIAVGAPTLWLRSLCPNIERTPDPVRLARVVRASA